MRKLVRKERDKITDSIVNDFRVFVNELPIRKRIKLAWKILIKTY